MNTKRCSNCFQTKPETEFYIKRTKHGPKDLPVIHVGRQSRCKACNAEVVRGYAQRKREERFLDWLDGWSGSKGY